MSNKMTFTYSLKIGLFKRLLNEKHLFYHHYSSNSRYNVLFFGSDGIALKSLKKINEFRKAANCINRLDLVTTNNSKHRSVTEQYAQKENLKTIPWPLQNVQQLDYDIGLIVAFGHLIRDHVLEKFPLGMVNVHPSLLPRWRGAAPIIHTLLHGDQLTGVSLMRIKPNIFDVGEIINQRTVPVPKDILLPELTEQLSEIGAEMLVDCMRTLPESLANAKPQSEEGVTYAKKINKSISDVRWSDMTATEVYNLYRAIYGLYPLTTTFRNKQLKLFDAFLDETVDSCSVSKPEGSLEYCEKKNAIRVLCKDKTYIYFRSLRIVGKKEITALDFYNGYIKNMPLEKRKCMVVK
ncbi:methionyl-tRNA formyltransferase, mitochondrial [Cydia pomonella]|uniref:methionyl-tRNA formyltransferase, mitochondrial n=1 Tax=Cydia pomonella TaxID=82600 RepID=UPI002ADDECA2|nr:methionyl-tRNA formyltransferase, mitochondrial [Cydia pomonella]